MRPLTLGLVAVALLALPPRALASNGPMPSTVGTKGPVSLPVLGDAQSMFRMPSSIAWSLDHRLDVDLFLVYTRAKMRNAQNDFDEGATGFGGSLGVVVAPGRPEWDPEADELDAPVDEPPASRWTFGLGIYPDIAGGQGRRDRVRSTTFPETFGSLKSLSFVTAALNVAFRPTSWLGLGVGLHAIYATIDTRALVGGNSTPLGGSPTINGVPIPGNPTYADFLALFASTGATDPTTVFDAKLTCVQFSATLSLSLRPTESFGIGLSYRERSWAPEPFEGEAEISAARTFERALGGLDPALQGLFLGTLPQGGANGFESKYDAELESVHVPRQVRLSVAAWPLDRWLIAAEVAWIEWHRAFGSARIRLKNGSNRDLNFVVGEDSIHTRLDSRWRNTWILSFYTSYGVTDAVTLRFGASWGESPFNADRQENSPSAGFVDTTLSLGAGWAVTEDLELNLLVEWAPETSDESSSDTQSLTARDTKYSSEQVFVHLGLGLRF